jgi:hypothetical protein
MLVVTSGDKVVTFHSQADGHVVMRVWQRNSDRALQGIVPVVTGEPLVVVTFSAEDKREVSRALAF